MLIAPLRDMISCGCGSSKSLAPAHGRTSGRTDKQADKRTGGRADGHNMQQTPHPHIVLNKLRALPQVAAQGSPRLLFSIIIGDGAGSINGALV